MIEIVHGIYDVIAETQYNLVGYWDNETITFLPICLKFKQLLVSKGVKFLEKYNIENILFTLGIDRDSRITVITICHPIFDSFDYELGEGITIGRIRRMRGDLQKRIYEYEKFEKKIKLYDKYDGFNKVETIYKTITCKRLKLDLEGKPVIKREKYFKPYDLERRYPDIEHKDGTIIRGKLMYPYIYMIK